MADAKLSALTSATPATGDLLYLVDVSDTTDGAAGSSRKAVLSAAGAALLALAYPASDGQRYKLTATNGVLAWVLDP